MLNAFYMPVVFIVLCAIFIIYLDAMDAMGKWFGKLLYGKERVKPEILKEIEDDQVRDQIAAALAELNDDGLPVKPDLVWDDERLEWVIKGREDESRKAEGYIAIRHAIRDSLIVIHSPHGISSNFAQHLGGTQGMVWVKQLRGEMSEAWTLEYDTPLPRFRKLTDAGSGVSHSLVGRQDTIMAIRSVNHRGLKEFSEYVQNFGDLREENVSVDQLEEKYRLWLKGLPPYKRQTIMTMLSIQPEARRGVADGRRAIDLS